MSSPKPCYLCGSPHHDTVPGRVRDMPELGILKCRGCGLVFLDSAEHISAGYYDEIYTQKNRGEQPWQHYLNRCRVDDERRARELEGLVLNKRYLDVGCGGGGVLLELQDRCARAAGVEPQRRWRQLLSERGFEIFESAADAPAQAFDYVSLFHVLEHVADPVPFLETVAARLAPGGRMLVEVPNADDALLSIYESKPFSEFTYWSPHLFLYDHTTIRLLAEKAGLAVEYVRHVPRYPLSDHLRWLAKGVGGGHVDWAFVDSPALTEAYAQQLASLGATDTLFASFMNPRL